ncbi:hypothetical protein CHARACLAT_020515 [Characodon lateralis]|uniref:Uncharacterized protein n=1 Tax=Characodon lateralis TaxID=208331 RepID=A0ABU7E5G3_9TELE|nr:hypothetical protein [Characodon lateralis]
MLVSQNLFIHTICSSLNLQPIRQHFQASADQSGGQTLLSACTRTHTHTHTHTHTEPMVHMSMKISKLVSHISFILLTYFFLTSDKSIFCNFMDLFWFWFKEKAGISTPPDGSSKPVCQGLI